MHRFSMTFTTCDVLTRCRSWPGSDSSAPGAVKNHSLHGVLLSGIHGVGVMTWHLAPRARSEPPWRGPGLHCSPGYTAAQSADPQCQQSR